MHTIYELKDMLCEELDEYGSKGQLDVGDLEIVDKLAHAIKNIDKIIECKEDEMYSMGNDGVSMRMRRDGGRDRRYRYSRENRRYSRNRGYSGADTDALVDELREIMQSADGKMKQEFEHFINKIEQM